MNLHTTELNLDLKDHFYDIAKPLLEYFDSNITKRIGIVTADIENSSRERIRKAVFRSLEKNKPSKKQMFSVMDSYAKIFSIIDNELNKNLGVLVREPINEKAMRKISFRVFSFYNELVNKLNRLDPKRTIRRAWFFAPKGFGGLMKDITRENEKDNLRSFKVLKRKLEDSPPDINDVRILSQAIYFKENNIFPNYDIAIASTDQHFCKVRVDKEELNTLIPDQIKKRFSILCDWPDNILKILKSTSNY